MRGAPVVAAFAFTFGMLGVFLHIRANEPKRIDLRVTPHLALAPSNVAIVVHVPRDPANRWLEIACSGPDYYRDSTKQIDGDLEPTTQYPLYLRDLPAGAYLISARLVTTEREYEVADRIELQDRGH